MRGMCGRRRGVAGRECCRDTWCRSRCSRSCNCTASSGASVNDCVNNLSLADLCCASNGSLRVGEAANPGPSPRHGGDDLVWCEMDVPRALSYPRPDKQGFYGVHSAGFSEDVATPPLDPYVLSFVTVNSTGWEPLQQFLQVTSAEVVCAQEHKLPLEDVPMASAWARRHGWKSLWAPAVRGGGGGWSAGTAILVRDHIGLRRPDVGPSQVCDGRVVAAVVEPPSCRPVLTYSAYLHHGRKLSEENVQILADIGAHWESQSLPTLQYVIGADFNLLPAQLTSLDLDDRLGGRTVAPQSLRGTCRTRTSSSTIDYFYMSSPMAELVESVETVEGTNIKTHVPVMATLYPRPAALKSLALRDPPPIPLERVYGPLPAPPRRWKEAQRAADALCRYARGGGEDNVARSRLDELYSMWADLAEQELCDITATNIPKYGCRGDGPSLTWKSILPERGAKVG